MIGYEEFYQISNLGRAYSKRTGKLMSIQHRQGKYCSIRVYDEDGIGSTLYIHRAVAELFVANPILIIDSNAAVFTLSMLN